MSQIPRYGWSCPNCGGAHGPDVQSCPKPARGLEGKFLTCRNPTACEQFVCMVNGEKVVSCVADGCLNPLPVPRGEA